MEDFADDFGHIVHHPPRVVERPTSTADVVAIMRRGVPVVARGRGHSTFGQAQSADGVLVDLSGLAGVTVGSHAAAGSCATVGAGATWRDVLMAALPDRTPPVLTDYLDVSVGGTLSVGGIGGTSHRHGLQTDQVVELEVVAHDGTVRVGGPGDPALASLGAAGIITRATVRLGPAPIRVRRCTLDLPTITDVMAVQRDLIREGRFDYVQGQITPGWRYRVETAAYDSTACLPGGEVEDMPYLAFADRLAPGEAYLRSTGEWFWPHPWWNGFLPDAAADDFVARLAAELTVEALGPSGLVLVYPIFTEHLTTPAFQVPDSPIVFLVAILRCVSAGSVPDALADNQLWYERARAAGGTVYPISAIPAL
ncbi:MAG TPA: FAD-binding protein [Pseudonocardiaceae bacterium]|jgi:FAD/FMN-containing dehydrogenase|nr:FAD-binding protein [Pseudonocardiaceae bacterium]